MTDLAALYERLPVTVEERWWVDLAAGAPGGRVLYVGCGTGRLALPLAGVCRELVALDADPAMLAVFAARLRDHPSVADVRLLAGRGEALPVRGRHGLVLLPANLLNELPSAESRARILEAAATRCRADGRVALQVLNPYWLATVDGEWVGRLVPWDGGDPVEARGRSNCADAWGQTYRTRIAYRFADGVELTHRFEAVAVFPAELRWLLRRAGLRPVERWGARPGQDPLDVAAASWHLVCVPVR